MTRKEQILKTAYEIVGASGIEGLHARTVAAKLGINHAAVHYYFRTRLDLISALAEYAVIRFENDRQRLLNRNGPGGGLEAVFAQALAYAKPESNFAKNWASFFVASIAEPALRPTLLRLLATWTEGLKSSLSETDLPETPLAEANVLAAVLLGIIVMAHACGEGYPAEVAIDSVAASLKAA